MSLEKDQDWTIGVAVLALLFIVAGLLLMHNRQKDCVEVSGLFYVEKIWMETRKAEVNYYAFDGERLLEISRYDFARMEQGKEYPALYEVCERLGYRRFLKFER